MDSLRVATSLPASPEEIYDTWLSGKGHAAMKGGAATSEPRKGGQYTAWDGYIRGAHLELDPGKRILQTWRTADFPQGAPDSRLEIRLATHPRGTRLTLLQSGIPDGQGEMYAEGWQEHYFRPMAAYFTKGVPKRAVPKKVAKKKAAKKKKVAKKKKATKKAAKKKAARRRP